MEWLETYKRHGIQTVSHDEGINAINRCKTWIYKWVSKRKTINRSRTSYGLKHCVENEHKPYPKYVPTEAFIQAAEEMGYRIKGEGLHRHFNMSYVKWDKEERKRRGY